MIGKIDEALFAAEEGLPQTFSVVDSIGTRSEAS